MVDGRNLVIDEHENGYFLGGYLFDKFKLTADMRIYLNEIFGPVLSVVWVATQQEAMDLTDAHEHVFIQE